ncbi:MAG: glycosyltransferase family 1 protein [Planctomycetes bacterium]|nr:glycosyltransferase family 1 protein [Planctomycetota bacterium]
MRILYHHRTQAEDGQAVHIRALIAAFRALGHEVREFSLVARAAAPAAATTAGRGSRYGWITRAPRFARELAEYAYGPATRARLLGAARDFRPDFVYERYAFANTAGVYAARRLAKPLVLEVNSPMVLELERTRGLSFPRLARRIEQHVFRSADLVCAVTGVLRDMLVEQGVRHERVLVTPNGVDPERYVYSVDARALARAALDLGALAADELVLGFVGFYRDWHRLDLVLTALARPALARTHLVLVGEGPARAELERQARALQLGARVHFAGARPHAAIPALLPAFDVALVPAINPYASPLKLFEYLAAGLAVLAPDQPNLREVLADGVDALLVPSGVEEPLANALVRLCSDAALRARLGAAARAKVAALDLTWQGNARRVLAAVTELER